MRKIIFIAGAVLYMLSASCCRSITGHSGQDDCDRNSISPKDIALLFSEICIGEPQIREVADAVGASSANGYDEEYALGDLFSSPGSGVGDRLLYGETVCREYDRPLRDLIREHLVYGRSSVFHAGKRERNSGVKTAVISSDSVLNALRTSDLQIYWPFSDLWDGKTMPVITFDPDNGSDTNVGYKVETDRYGNRMVREVVVDEQFALSHPVWVINRNNDAGYVTPEMYRKLESARETAGVSVSANSGRVSSSSFRTLVLKDFTMHRNFDPWFAGASEFFVKIGAVENFSASTEAELNLYSPSITDFMIVVKRKYVGKPIPYNAVLVSDWTEQLENCALMIVEDDGGTRTSWKCTAYVKIASKSYGFEISLPFNTKDDIVWRGQLNRKYIEASSNVTGHFGDVDLTFELLEHSEEQPFRISDSQSAE